MVVGERHTALAHLVGDSRAYVLQLASARDELAALHDDDLAPLLTAVDGAALAVRAVDAIGTGKLRST